MILVRDLDGEIRAFHNVCRHRGNKILWDHSPRETASGTCRQFMCKYHGWRYGLDGALNFVLQEEEFFDFDKADFGLVPVHCDVWEGFIFINLDREPRQSLREFLGPMVTGLDGYPFDLMTERYAYTASVTANWKMFLDVFQEYYHVPILHSQQQVSQLRNFESGFKVPYFQLDGPHRVISTGGWKGTPRHLMDHDLMYPVEVVGRSRSASAVARRSPELEVENLPPGVNPGKLDPWSVSTFNIFPNLVILLYERGWYLTYRYWPTSTGTHDWEMEYWFPASRRPRADPARGHRGDVEGGRDPGHGDARRHAAGARVAGGRPVPAVGPGDHGAALPHGGGRLGRRVPARRTPEHHDDRCAVARRVRRPRAVRGGGVVPRDRARALHEASRERDVRAAGVLRRGVPPVRARWSTTSTSSRSTTCRSPSGTCCTSCTRSSRSRSRSTCGASRTSIDAGNAMYFRTVEPIP